MPRSRFTVKRMMWAVAGLSIPLALISLVLRQGWQTECFAKSYKHKNICYNLRCMYLEPAQREVGGEGLDAPMGDSPDLADSPIWKAVLDRCPEDKREPLRMITERHIYHKRMQAKWDRALRHPWEAVPADPPPPPPPFPSWTHFPFRFTPFGGM